MQDEFMSLTQAIQHRKLTKPWIARRVASGELAIYADPRDRRRRLLKVDQLDALLAEPRPLPLEAMREGGADAT